jgi:hypothetical protein
LKAPGFNPGARNVISWFQAFAFKCNLYRYSVVFTPRHAPALPLVFGANVTSVEVHDGVAREEDGEGGGEAADATEAVVVFRIGGGGCAVPPMHLCGGGSGASSVCFSLAPMGLKVGLSLPGVICVTWTTTLAVINWCFDCKIT